MDTILRSFFNRDTQIAALAELVGTFFLTLAALLGGSPYAVGLTLGALVYAIGNVSGCHINPAVTVGLMSGRHFPVGTGVFYIVAQIVGALLARLLAGLIGDIPQGGNAAGITAEFFGFGLLMLTVAAVTTDKRVPAAGSGIAIGAALTGALLWSKGILNPAVALVIDPLSAATWATLLSAFLLTNLFRLFLRSAPQ